MYRRVQNSTARYGIWIAAHPYEYAQVIFFAHFFMYSLSDGSRLSNHFEAIPSSLPSFLPSLY